MPDQFRIVPYKEQPELANEVADIEAETFPKFIEEDRIWAEVAPHFYDEFSDYQFFVVDAAKNRFVGLCNNVPFRWDGNPNHLPGYHRMLSTALVDWRAGKKPNSLSSVQVIIDPAYRGQDVPGVIFGGLTRLVQDHLLTSLVSAIRPTLKEQYPLTPIEEYVLWRRKDGELFDPWLRAQEKLGAELIKSVPDSTVIEGTISDWEGWTGMTFPASGDYWLPGGLATLNIDLTDDIGRHNEPHVWFKYPMNPV
jgi:GNAT superfamily N-acetyltransferase